MKEKIEKIDYKYKITIFTFILFLIIEVLSPISGDDWKSYVIGKSGLVECFKNISFRDGRIISGFLVNFLSYNKILFDISFAFLISRFVKMCNDLQGDVKTKYCYLYPLIGILVVSSFMFSYNYVSITSTVTYTIPALLFIFYFYDLNNSETNVYKIIKRFLISTYIIFSSIHMAIIFFIANLVYFVLFSLKKKNIINFSLIIYNFILLLISFFNLENGLFVMDFNNSLGNISYMIENVFSKNIVLIIIGSIPINLFLSEKLNNKTYGRVVIVLFDIILAFSLSYNFFNYIPFNINLVLKKYSGIFATENWYYVFYFLTYIILYFISVNYYLKNNKIKKYINILNISSILMLIFTLCSSTFDLGNIVLIMFSIIITVCIITKETNMGVHVKIIRALAFLLVLFYVSSFAVIKYIDVKREEYIKEQLNDNVTNIEVKANPVYLVWRHNPTDYFQHNDFKNYYEIPEKDTIEVKYFGVFEKIERIVKDDK